MPLINGACPICSEAIAEPAVSTPDFVEVRCRTCGRFRIAKPSIDILRGATAAERRNHLLKAIVAAQDGKVPLIGGTASGGAPLK
jgi:NMD protein affecting ribosome stability and mRNA decay